jgi:hypothetical protein
MLNAYICGPVSFIRRLVAVLPPQRPRFYPKAVHMGIVLVEETLGKVSLRALRYFAVSIIPPTNRVYLVIADTTQS